MSDQRFIYGNTLFFSFFMLELIFGDRIFDWSVNASIYLQENSGPDDFYLFFTAFGYVQILGSIILISILLQQHNEQVVRFFMIIIISVYLDVILKFIYQKPRPYWVDLRVNAKQCELEFGDPSGHAHLCSFIFLGFNKIFIQDKFQNNVLKTSIFIASLTFVFMICFSRMYLGAHSLNQVTYGFLLAVWSLWLYFSYIEQKLHNFLVQLQNKQKPELFLLYSLFIAANVFNFILYIVIINSTTINPNWNEMVVNKCNIPYGIMNANNSLFKFSSVINTVFGLFFGLYIRVYDNNQKNNQNQEDRKIVIVKRGLLFIVIEIIIAVPLQIIPTNFSSYLDYIKFTLIQLLVSIAFMQIHQLYNKLGLNLEEDILFFKSHFEINKQDSPSGTVLLNTKIQDSLIEYDNNSDQIK